MDDVDIQILNLLREDSRMSLRQVSIKVDKAIGTVMKRIKDLQNEGILKKYTVVLDPIKLGYTQTAVILVQTNGRIEFIKNTVSKMPSVIFVYQITGDFDIVITAKFKENSDLASFVKQLQKINGIRRIVPSMALNVIKEDITSLCVA